MKQPTLALAGLILLVGCHPITNSTKSGGLTIVFQSAARTVVPSDQALEEFKARIDRYSVVLVNSDTNETKSKTSASGEESVTLGDLEDGTWNIEGAAVSQDGEVLAAGTAAVTVEGGQTASVEVKLSATQNGTGQFEFRFTVPDNLGIASVKATLVRDGNSPPLTLQRGGRLVVDVDKDLLAATLQTIDFDEDGVLPSGTYLLLLDFLGSGGESLGRHGEAVNIWDDIVSGAWLGPDGELHDTRAFDTFDIASSYALPYSIDLVDANKNTIPFDLSTFQYTLPATSSLTLRGAASMDGQLLEVSTNGGPRTTVSWEEETAIALTGVERLAIRITAPNRQTFLEYVFGKAQSATLKTVQFSPAGLTGDQHGNLYVVDRGDAGSNIGGRIIKIDVAGNETVFAGDGLFEGDDGAGSTASFVRPYGITRDDAGNYYVAEDFSNSDGRIRRILPDGTVSTIVALGAGLKGPSGIAVTRDGTMLYVADRYNNRIVKVKVTNGVGTIEGAVLTGLSNPDSVALSPDERFLAVGGNGDMKIYLVDLNGSFTTLASGELSFTYGVTFGPDGAVYVCLVQGHKILKAAVNVTGSGQPSSFGLSVAVGSGSAGGVDGVGETATTNDPWHIYRSPYTGVFYFTERGSKKIRSFQ